MVLNLKATDFVGDVFVFSQLAMKILAGSERIMTCLTVFVVSVFCASASTQGLQRICHILDVRCVVSLQQYL